MAGLFFLYAGLAVVLPPADDELYYWCWSRDLQLSYYDHPAMVAYLIRFSTTIFGQSVFALRLPAVLATLVAFAVVAHLLRWRSTLLAVLLTPLFTFGAILVTPDTPLLLFWSLYLLWLTGLHRRLNPAEPDPTPRASWGYWVLGGVLLGGGVLGKYTMALAIPAGAVSLAFVRPWSRWYVGYLIHGLIAFGIASPILIFNIQRDFAPLQYQWEHATASGRSGLVTFGEFVGVQALGFGLLPFVLLPWAVWNARRFLADPVLRVCLCLYVVPLSIFTYKSMKGPLEGNWAIVSYLGFWPIAAAWYDSIRQRTWMRRFALAACLPPAICVLVFGVHLIHPWSIIPPRLDRVTRQFDRVAAMKEVAAAIRARGESVPVFTPIYQHVALLRYFGVDARQIDGVSRPSHFTHPPEHPRDHDRVLIVAEGPLQPPLTDGFAPAEHVFHTRLVVRGEWVSTYYVWSVRKSRSP